MTRHNDAGLPYDNTGERCPTAGSNGPSPPSPHYQCLADRCVELADGNSAGTADPGCDGECAGLAVRGVDDSLASCVVNSRTLFGRADFFYCPLESVQATSATFC